MNRTVRRWLVPAAAASVLSLSASLAAPAPTRAAIPDCLGRTPTIVGTHGNDQLVGTAGADVIVGLGGDDEIFGGAGNDRICGNAGDDVLAGRAGADILHGGADSDVLLGGSSADVLHGGSGDDTLEGNTGNDTYDGGAGTDFIDFRHALAGVIADIRAGTATGDGSDTLAWVEGIVGSRFGDELFGNAASNVLIGLEGGDVLHGRGEFDFVAFIDATASVTLDLEARTATGEGSDDVLAIEGALGSPHDDTLLGTAAGNYLDGADGFDTIDGRGGNDTCFGEDVSNCEPPAATVGPMPVPASIGER